MPDTTKNEAIIATLNSAGFQRITLSVIPKCFVCENGLSRSELEFSRSYFNDTPLLMLRAMMQEKIIPALTEHQGKKVYVTARGISIISRT